MDIEELYYDLSPAKAFPTPVGMKPLFVCFVVTPTSLRG